MTMPDEYIVCAAAFFRNKGSNIIAENGFVMSISMDMHWLSYGLAKTFLEILLSRGLLIKTGEFIKPSFEISDVEVPVAYKPSESFKESLKNAMSKQPTGKATVAAKKTETPSPAKEQPAGNDLLPMMIQEAVESGMEKRDFISEANSVSKKLNIDMLVAGLVVLRDRGINIDSLADRVYDSITSR